MHLFKNEQFKLEKSIFYFILFKCKLYVQLYFQNVFYIRLYKLVNREIVVLSKVTSSCLLKHIMYNVSITNS